MVFEAKFPGRCDDCREEIRPGQMIESKPNGTYVHEVCPDGPDDFSLKARESVCPVCFMVRAVDGSCECEVG